MTFIERIDELCKEQKISKRKLEEKAGLGIGSTTKWKTMKPSQSSIQKVSEFFGVSVAYLIGESEHRTEQDAIIERWKQEQSAGLADEVRRIEAGIRIPVLGDVPCGIPIEAIEMVDADEWEEISEKMSRSGSFFGLKVKGDSMSPRMEEGDILIVKQQEDAETGDIVIAKIDGEDACCKKLLKTDSGIVLQSFNPVFAPMFFSNEEIVQKPVQIIGKVVEFRAKLI